MSIAVAADPLSDTLDDIPEDTVVLDGTGRRWSHEQWCTAGQLCTLLWVGPDLTTLTSEQLAVRGPITVLCVPGEGLPEPRHLLGECI